MTNRILMFVMLTLLAGPASAQGINFSASAELTASPDNLTGHVSLTLNADQSIHDTLVYALAQGERRAVFETDYWEPGTQKDFELDQLSTHGYPGNYHLLIELAFRDQAGANLSVSMQLIYRVGEEVNPKPAPEILVIEGDRLQWRPAATQVADVRLAVTTAPSWAMVGRITPPDARIELVQNVERPAFPNRHYPQMARLEWVQDGRHFSRVFNWSMYTDANGNWKRRPEPVQPEWWRNPALLFTISLLVVLTAGFALWRRTRKSG
jgi:hypothetical protein